MQGMVLSFSNLHARVLCEDGVTRLCTLKGKRIKALEGWYNALAAGDQVIVQPTGQNDGVISGLLPRRSIFGRYNEKGESDQAFAANIDLAVCVTSTVMPPFRPRFVDRISVMAEQAEVPLLIVLNKIDLGISEYETERLKVFESLGWPILPTSVQTGEGIETLRMRLVGKVSVFVGQSGAGKSSLINLLIPGAQRKTGEVSEKYNRGRHTTTLAELIVGPDSAFSIIDTPGFRRLAIRGIDPDDLAACFPEMAPLIGTCGFGASCTHTHESGCAIRNAVNEGRIHYDRYESYLRIRAELESNTRWKKQDTSKKRRDTWPRYEEEAEW